MPHILLLGTLDTKLEEFSFLYDRLVAPPFGTNKQIRVTLIDCGRTPVQDIRITISQPDLVHKYGNGPTSSDLPRGEVIKYMIDCTTRCVKKLIDVGDVHGIISAGGSGGSSLVSAVMRNGVPIGMPKLIVSTVASGDTGPLVGESDIAMLYSVVDIAGNNELLQAILGNAASAMVGMASSYEDRVSVDSVTGKLRIGITMFGVTTPCVDHIRGILEKEENLEVFVFHATGHGGRAMERLINEKRLDAVIDLTTTEICDYLVGGTMSAGPDRLDAALRAEIPYFISLGATDMVNFGPISSVPLHYKDRQLLEHNPTVTLMRTNKHECKQVARFIADKVKTYCTTPSKVRIYMPRGGVSMLSTGAGPFADRDADDVLFQSLLDELHDTSVATIEDPRDINDPGFAAKIASDFLEAIKKP